MKKLMMAAIGMVACSVVTGCWTGSVSQGGSYANLPDPKPDEYLIHWANDAEKVTMTATVKEILSYFEVGEKAPWMLRDKEVVNFFGMRRYTLEDKARNAALFKACQEKGCDALFGAMYKIDTTSYGPFYSESTCTVEGWPAHIKGIENVATKAK